MHINKYVTALPHDVAGLGGYTQGRFFIVLSETLAPRMLRRVQEVLTKELDLTNLTEGVHIICRVEYPTDKF